MPLFLPSHNASTPPNAGKPTLGTLALITSLFLLGAAPLKAEAPHFALGEEGPISYESAEAEATSKIWRTLAEDHDFDVVFSPKLRDLKVEIQVKDATLADIFDRLAIAGDQFWQAMDDRTVLVANDTPQQRRAYEPQAVHSQRLENIRVADAMTAVRSIYGLKHVTADEPRQTITMRDFASKIELASNLISHLDVPEDEVTVRLELVRVPEKLWRRGRDTSSWLKSGQAESVLRTDLGIVGRRKARFDMEERLSKSGDRFAVGVEIEARVHPGSREITLALDSRLATADAASGDLEESKQTTSSWRIGSGETRLIELPGRLGADGQILALAMTPEIVRSAEGETQKAQWIKAALPHSMSSESKARLEQEVKERLQRRLAEKNREPDTAPSPH